MQRILSLILTCTVAAVLSLASGCVVHDNNRDAEPVWWPTFMLREDTLRHSGGKVDVRVDPSTPAPRADAQPSGALIGGMSAASMTAPLWFDPGVFYNPAAWYTPPNYNRPLGTGEAPAPFPQLNTPSLYPTRGQAAIESGSPTLYPPNGFLTSPGRDVSLYPHGPTGPSGFRGK